VASAGSEPSPVSGEDGSGDGASGRPVALWTTKLCEIGERNEVVVLLKGLRIATYELHQREELSRSGRGQDKSLSNMKPGEDDVMAHQGCVRLASRRIESSRKRFWNRVSGEASPSELVECLRQ
jgi:hypothetical protein